MDTEHNQKLLILIKEAQNGSKEAFKGIFEHLSNKLFAYALTRTAGREDAMDIVQETFIELWEALKKFNYRSDEEFYGFVFIITKRKLYRYYRQKPKTVYLDDNLIEESYEMEPNDYRYMVKHINSLTSNYQDLLKLRYWSGMTFGEIASALDITETTAKVWHHRAIKKLQVSMEKYDNAV